MNNPLAMPWDNGVKPFFVNPEGFEWYRDKDTTDWAQRNDQFGVKLENVVGVLIRKGEFAKRLLMDKTTNEILFESFGLEDVCVRIDIMKTHKRYDK